MGKVDSEWAVDLRSNCANWGFDLTLAKTAFSAASLSSISGPVRGNILELRPRLS